MLKIRNDDTQLSPFMRYINRANKGRAGDRYQQINRRVKRMKTWILMIFRLAQSARRLIDKLQGKIERIALDPFGRTEEQYKKILALTDKRVALINFIYLHRLIVEAIGSEEATVLELYARGATGREIGEARGESVNQIFVRLRRVMNKASKALKKAGYDCERLEKEYLIFDDFKHAYYKLSCGMRKAKRA